MGIPAQATEFSYARTRTLHILKYTRKIDGLSIDREEVRLCSGSGYLVCIVMDMTKLVKETEQ
jgi:hypothetical protein